MKKRSLSIDGPLQTWGTWGLVPCLAFFVVVMLAGSAGLLGDFPIGNVLFVTSTVMFAGTGTALLVQAHRYITKKKIVEGITTALFGAGLIALGAKVLIGIASQ